MYTRTLRVMPSDASMTGELKIFNLLNYLQDTAELAVEGIEGKSTELYAKGFAWVVTKYEIFIKGDLPKICDEFSVSTYHDPNHSYNTLRMFHVSFKGNEIVTAKTSWILADVNSGRPVKAIAHIPGIETGDCQNIDDGFTDIPDVTEPDISESFTVKYHDTDYNGHVNHAVYFRWVYDIFGKARHICGAFRSGAKFGETVTLQGRNGAFHVLREGISRPCAKFFLEAD